MRNTEKKEKKKYVDCVCLVNHDMAEMQCHDKLSVECGNDLPCSILCMPVYLAAKVLLYDYGVHLAHRTNCTTV